MIKLSAKCEYALRIVDFLRRTPGLSADLSDIGAATGVPISLLRKIAAQLVATDILRSERGRFG
jgi:DNA-binding IscR family transcriptional regulator